VAKRDPAKFVMWALIAHAIGAFKVETVRAEQAAG
jgi:hypothetical protein